MRDAHQRGIQEGMQVVSADGHVVGSIVDVRVSERGSGPETGVVYVRPAEGGGEEFSIPFSDIRSVDEDSVTLDVERGELRPRVSGADVGSSG